MRVKLQYSVELDEVPKEARRLVSRANGEIRDAGDHMDDIFVFIDSGTDYENILDSIEQARKKLTEADFRLGDAEAILHGYMQAKYGQQQDQNDLGQIQEQLEALKGALSDTEEEPDEQP